MSTQRPPHAEPSAEASRAGPGAASAMTFTVYGLIDSQSVTAVEAAVRTVDPAATVVVSLPAQLVRVHSNAPAQSVRQSIESAGFIAEPSTRALPAPSTISARAVARLSLRAVAWALAWMVFAPVLTLLAVGGLAMLDPRCGTPGDSGGCEMGMAAAAIAAIPFGAGIAFIATFGLGLWRMGRPRPAG